MRGPLVLGACAAMLLAAPARSQEPALSAAEVVALARTRSPGARLAATEVAEARARLRSARVFARDNPEVEALRATGDGPSTTSLEATIPLGGGLRRSRRVAEARAGVEQERLAATGAEVEVVAEALRAYYGILHARALLGIAVDRRDLASQLVEVADERFRAGDAPRLDLIAAEAERSRAEAEILAGRSAVGAARRALAAALGGSAGEAPEVTGSLEDRAILEAAIAGAPERHPDVVAAEHGLRAAESAVSLASLGFLPDVALRLDYERSEGDGTLTPGVAVALPLFDRGAGEREEALARRDRARVELEAREAAMRAAVAAARSAYASLAEAAKEIERGAYPRALEVEELAGQSYEAGKMDLPTLLVVRSQALETRRERADRLRDAADAGIDLLAALGALPPDQP